jgi:hypothetical protein
MLLTEWKLKDALQVRCEESREEGMEEREMAIARNALS